MSDPKPFSLPPGIVKQESIMAATGRYIASDMVRWVRSKPEKIGGWAKMTTTAIIGIARGMLGWSDGTARQIVAVGTERRLYVVPLVEYEPVNITPLKGSTTDADPLTTVNGSASVRVYYPAHNSSVGDGVTISNADAFNGVDANGDFTITSIVDGDIFTITAAALASASGPGGGAAVKIELEVPIGLSNPTTLFGYGTGKYGMGTYGTPRAASAYVADNRQWFLQSFGRMLLANYSGSPLYFWDPLDDSQKRADPVTGSPAPTVMTGFIVTAERIVIAFGTDSSGTRDLLEVWTSRQGDFMDWDFAALPNDQGAQATVSRLAYGRKVVAAAVLGNFVNILWTDAAVYTKQYTGSANVYLTAQKGTDCGLIGPMAFAIHHNIAYWVSPNKAFHMFNGAEQRMPNSSDIAEWIFKKLRDTYQVKTFTTVNPRYGEVWFHFVVDDNAEPTLAAIYNIEGQFWFTCSVERSSVTLLAGQSEPVMAGDDGFLYKHETGLDGDGAPIPWTLESAPFALRHSGVWAECFRIFMDMQRQVGDVSITITAWDGTHANAAPIGTEVLTASPDDSEIYPRFSGRQMSIKFEGDGLGNDFRLGVPSIVIEQGASR